MSAAPAIEVRRLDPGDEAVLERCDPEVFEHPTQPAQLQALLRDPRQPLIVALHAGRVIGMAGAVQHLQADQAPRLLITELAVATPWRRCGVGTRLLEALLAVARDQGCPQVWVVTEIDNEAAKTLYARCGGGRDEVASLVYRFRGV